MSETEERPSRVGGRRRRWLYAGIALAATLAAAAHWHWHYRPRLRSLPSSPSTRVGALWNSLDADVAVWLGYPHQNLAALEQRIGDLDAYLADLGVVVGDEPLRLPRFGPFRFPPASELVAIESHDDARWRAAAQVYPLIGVAARSAGRLTSNAWLGGGEVNAGGNSTRIQWRGNLWSFGNWPPGGVPSQAALRDDRLIGRLRLQRAVGRWPVGDYDLFVEGGSLWLGSHPVPSAELAASVDWGRVEGLPLILRDGTAKGERALLFFDGGEGAIPSVVSIARGAERFELPGERLLGRLGGEVVEVSRGDWLLAAYSESDLDRVFHRLDRLASPVPVGRAVRLAAGPVSRMSRALGTTLEEIPIIGKREAARWMALARLLEPLGEDGVVEVSLADPVYLRIVVSRD